MADNELELIRLCKQGDTYAFEKLIQGYEKRVFNIAYRMLNNYDDASEVAQEVFLKVFRSINSFKEESAFSTWLYRIAVNVCMDELRKRKNMRIISVDQELQTEDGDVKFQLPDESPGPEILAEKKELKQMIEKALQELSDEHRQVIVLRDLNDLSYEEIGRILDCPIGTVKSRINRARQTLKSILLKNTELLKSDSV